MKKKFLVFLIVLCTFCFTLGFAACSDNSEEPDTAPRIELPVEALELEVGQTAQITPVVKNAEGTVLWQSSAPAVASVDQTGLITANAVGESVISVLRPLQEEAARLERDKAYIDGVIRANAEKAGYYANKTLRKVQKKVGFPERVR